MDVYYEWINHFNEHPFADMQVGSVEGNNRSWANYIEIKATEVIPNN